MGGGAAAVLVAAALLVLRPWDGSGTAAAGLPDGPVGILAVEEILPGVCPTSSPQGRSWTSDDRQSCVVTRSGEGLTVQRFEEVRARRHTEPGMDGWAVDVTLREPDRAAFRELTDRVTGRSTPRDQVAFVIRDDARLLAHVHVVGPLESATFTIGVRLKENEARFLAQALGADS